MGRLIRNKMLAIMALGAMIGLLLLPIFVSMPALAGGGGAPAAGGPPPDVAKKADAPEAAKVEKGRDVYYKTEGIVTGAPAPKTADNPQFYPRYNFESRVLLWFANQQHLYYGSFVLAVPIFCMIIEFMGIVSKDKAMAKKYDQLAYDFIKISLTAYSLTAILGGILIFTFLTLYPAFFGYLSSIFRPVMHIYALLFVAESGTIYIYYYGWDRMKEGLLKWIHASMSVVLNVIGTVLMFLANSWIGFMMSPAGVDEQGRYLGNIWHCIHTALWNPLNVHRLLGFTAEELRGADPAFWTERIHPDDRARTLEGFGALFERGVPFEGEYRFQRKDGTWIWLQSRAAATPGAPPPEGGHVYGVLSDITARKAADEAPREEYVKKFEASENLRWSLSGETTASNEQPLGKAAPAATGGGSPILSADR